MSAGYPQVLQGQPVAAAPVQQPQTQLMQVQVPQGMAGGMMLQVQTPAGLMKVQIPAGLQAGQTFRMRVPLLSEDDVLASNLMKLPLKEILELCGRFGIAKTASVKKDALQDALVKRIMKAALAGIHARLVRKAAKEAVAHFE